jgi:hypothetical protein
MISSSLLISECYVKDNGPVVGAFDFQYLIPFVKIAQDIDVSEIVGERLLNRIYEGVANSDLNPDEVILLESYIQPVVLHYAMYRGMNHLVFKVDNSGLTKRNSDSGTSADLNESSFLAEQEKTIAESYGRRLADYLDNNGSLYPEYKTESEGEIKPSDTARFSGGLWLGSGFIIDEDCEI